MGLCKGRLATEAESEKGDEAVVGSDEAQLPRRRSRLLPHDLLDGADIHVDLLGRRCLGERLQMRAHVLDLGDGREDRALDLLGDVVRVLQCEIARELQMERDLHTPVDLEDAQVVDLPHLRHAERGRQHSLADLRVRVARFYMYDYVGIGKALTYRVLDPVRRCMALSNRGTRSDPDDDVREVPAARLAHAEAPELHRRVQRGDCLVRCVLRGCGRPVHEHVDVPAEQASSRTDYECRDEKRGDRVALGKSERSRREPCEHRERSHEVAAEVERVREERVAPIAPSGAQGDRCPHRVDGDHEPDRRERPPGRVHLRLDRTGQTRDG